MCLKLLLQQQPVAKDLRTISSALKMISDMERIGDQASDIAEKMCIRDGGITFPLNMSFTRLDRFGRAEIRTRKPC